MKVFRLIVVIFTLVSLLTVVGCVQPFGPDDEEEDDDGSGGNSSSYVWIMNATNVEIQTDSKFSEKGPSGTAFFSTLAFVDDSSGTGFVFTIFDNLSTASTAAVTMIYQVNGVTKEITFFGSFQSGQYTENVFDASLFPDGIDYYDPDGDGEFMATIPSDDDPYLAFKQVSIDGSIVWTNPYL
jgi:hypothetical protein